MTNRSRSIVLTVLATSLSVACTSLPPAQSARDLRTVAGKWEGTFTSTKGFRGPATLTVREDGNWEVFIPNLTPNPRAGGMTRVEGGKYRWESKTTGRTGTWTLHEGGGRRVLVVESDDGGTRPEYSPAR